MVPLDPTIQRELPMVDPALPFEELPTPMDLDANAADDQQ